MRIARRAVAALSLSLSVLIPAAPAAADPPAWSGAWQVHERYHRPDEDGEGRVLYLPGSLPAGEDVVPVARGLPYGFNRGTCDRSLLDAATARAMPVGGAVGRAMDDGDRECLWGALESLPDNRTIAWTGDAGTLFRVSTQRTYMRGGAFCRDWRANASLPGHLARISGTFCRRSDGQWVSAK